MHVHRFNIAPIDSNIFHIKYKIRGGALQLNFELPQLKCLAKRRTLQLKLSPRTFIKITFPTAVTYDTHMETVIHSDNICMNTHTYIYSYHFFKHFVCAFDLFFASIMQANPVSLPPVAPPAPLAACLRLLFKCKCAEMSLMFLNILHCSSWAPVVDSGLTVGSSYRCASVCACVCVPAHLKRKSKWHSTQVALARTFLFKCIFISTKTGKNSFKGLWQQ